jgi:hypothetical protein
MSVKTYINVIGITSAALIYSGSVQAFTFETENFEGNFDSTIQAGFGVRMQDQSCSRIGDPTVCANADVGGWSNADDGNLNYNKGGLFTEYLKGNHELLLKFGQGWKFLGRATWLLDAAADNTDRTDLTDSAKKIVARDARILDFWVSKEFALGDNQARVRVGNQVINWGESLFLPGGINATNAVDVQRLSQPGVQLKEVQLPAPMVSASTGIGKNVNVEAYYQFGWNKSRFAPVGGYWSAGDIYDKGSQPAYFDNANFNIGGLDPAAGGTSITSFGATRAKDDNAKNDGQFGVSARYQPTNTNLNLAVYAMNYHDKTPNLSIVNGTSYKWSFLENRQLYGASMNFPVGNWAIGAEVAYRPKDAVALSGCYVPVSAGGSGQFDANTNGQVTADCKSYMDQKRYDVHLTSLLSLTPSDYGGILKALGGAQTATLLAEAVFIRYPDLQDEYTRTTSDGVPVLQTNAAGYWFRTTNDATLGTRIAKNAGTKNSWGYNFDLSWTYDGTLIPGWQVTPEVYYFQAVSGRTPNFGANFAEGAKSANFLVTFTQNPAKWQAGLNYATWWGGKDSFDQPFADRDFFGAYLSRNF